ncbi:MAG: hypothetical protein WAO50_12405 [Candidatus Nanopelagicales bacterium]
MNPVHQHPAWFGSVMGTGATSIVLVTQSETWDLPWLAWLGVAFLLLATGLAIVLWPRYGRRLVRRRELVTELSDPGHGAMLATLPAGLLVLAAAWARVGPEIIPTPVAVWIDIVLGVIGVILATGIGIVWANAIASNTNDLASVNGGWLIPAAMNLIVPLTIVPVMLEYPEQAPWLMVVAFAFFGIGTVLFMAMFTLIMTRLALRPRQVAQMAPSLWIPLAPAGVLGFGLLRLLQVGEEIGLPGFDGTTAGIVVASMGVGFGLWWALFAGLEQIRLRREGGVPFHPGWWGYVFPVAAMTLSIIAIGTSLDSAPIKAAGVIATLVLALVWVLVAVRTIRLVTKATAR